MPKRPLDTPERTGPTLGDYFGWLSRRWSVLVAGAVVGVAAGAGFTALETPMYTATTTVMVKHIGLDASAVRVNLDTEAQLIRSVVVANRAKTLMRVDDAPESLIGGVSITVPPNSQVLVVAFEASSRERARDGSHAFTQAYLDLQTDLAKRELDAQVAGIREQMDTVNTQLTEVAARIAVLPVNSVDRQRAEADRNVLTNQLAALNSRLSPMLTMPLDPGSIITDATLPAQPSSPNRLLNLASGFGGGLLLGIAAALLMDRLDTRIRRRRDLNERLGIDVLVEIADEAPATGLVAADHPLSRDLARLRNVLVSRTPDKAPGVRGRRLLVSGASTGTATGFVVGNLAAAYARAGAEVVVVTTNVNSPLSTVIDGVPTYSLADILAGKATPLKALNGVPNVPDLKVVVAGALDTDTELPVPALLDMVGQLSARFDHVIIETGPPSLAVEAQALADHVDAVVVVAEIRRTHHQEVTATVHHFEQVDAPLLGVVLAPHMNEAGRMPASGDKPARPMPNAVTRLRQIPAMPINGRVSKKVQVTMHGQENG
jgi:polysaccharide biosynthesis transport protein